MTNGASISEKVTKNLPSLPEALDEFLSEMTQSVHWIQRDWQLFVENPAHFLLTDVKISLLESATSWALGSNRGAAASLRAAVESAFAWLYYKDHPVELKAFKERLADMLLPKAVQNYFKNIDSGFDASYDMLKKTKSRATEYFYSEISQYVHAYPKSTSGASIEESVISCPRDRSFLQICRATDEFIADNYLAVYRASWGDFPNQVQEDISKRLGSNLAKFVEIQ